MVAQLRSRRHDLWLTYLLGRGALCLYNARQFSGFDLVGSATSWSVCSPGLAGSSVRRSIEATDERVQPYGGPGPPERDCPEPSADHACIEVADAGTDDYPTEKHPAATPAPAPPDAYPQRYCR